MEVADCDDTPEIGDLSTTHPGMIPIKNRADSESGLGSESGVGLNKCPNETGDFEHHITISQPELLEMIYIPNE